MKKLLIFLLAFLLIASAFLPKYKAFSADKPILTIKKIGPASAAPGSIGIYKITLKNIGNSTAINTVVKDLLPNGVVFLSAYPTPSSVYQDPPYDKVIQWNVGDFEPNSSKDFTLKVRFPLFVNGCVTFKNKAIAFADNADKVETNFDTIVCAPNGNNGGSGENGSSIVNPINVSINPPERICIGAKSKFVFTFTGGVPPYSYVVNFGDGTEDIKGKESGKFTTILHTYTKEGTYIVSIDVKDSKGTESKLTRSVKAINCEVVLNVYHQNFIIGYPDGTFKPDKNVSRAEVATMICRALGFEANTYNYLSKFKDLKSNKWYFGFVKKAVNEKLMNGRSSSMFYPEKPATRAEIAAILVKIRGLKPETPQEELFTDIKRGDWFEGYVYTAVKAGLIQGYKDHTFKPNNTVTRAEFVTLVDRALYREDIPQANNINNLPSSPFPDITPSYWAYRYIIEASVPHIVTNALRAPINLSLPSKTIPVYLASTKSNVTFPNLNSAVNAIVPVDGISNGKDPEERKVQVRIINKGKP